jgi:uncharacterized protein YegL
VADKELTHIVFLLDRSGSMQSIKTDVVGGFQAFVTEQRGGEGKCRVTLAQFDNEYEVVYQDISIEDVPPLDLSPRGSTALLDSMGKLIIDTAARIAALPEEARPATVIVAIMTDGHENASMEWTRPAIKALVEQQTNDHGWQFLYMGADQDAVEVGTSLGVGAEHSVTYARGRSREAWVTTSGKVRGYRDRRILDEDAAMPGYTAEERSTLAEE